MKGDIDFAAIGYPAVREVFNATLQLCVEKLSKAEIDWAAKILEVAMLDEDTPGMGETSRSNGRPARTALSRRIA